MEWVEPRARSWTGMVGSRKEREANEVAIWIAKRLQGAVESRTNYTIRGVQTTGKVQGDLAAG